MSFLDKLKVACATNQSLLCVGLDPDPDLMPVAAGEVFQFNQAIIDATADLVCAYKPNLAFYEALGIDGLKALAKTIHYIREVSDDLLIIGDAKRGDVGASAAAYAKSMFSWWGFDAITVNGYGGRDTVLPYLASGDKGVFVWCHSSNPDAGDLQKLAVQGPGDSQPLPLYHKLATIYVDLIKDENVGLVIGGTYPRELEDLRYSFPETPFLIPGIGSQGGDLAKAIRYGGGTSGRLAIISSSRQILYAGTGKEFPLEARRQASKLRDSINEVLTEDGKGWS